MEGISMQICKSLALFFLFFGAIWNHGVEAKALSPRDHEIKRYLKKMNKPVVKTIKSPMKELIDCVDIYKQPSLDHPLLRNHTVQMKPSFIPSNIHEEESSNEIHQAWHINGKCPEGTIPIRRIQKRDILKASSLQSFGKKYPPNFLPAAIANGHEHSVVYLHGGSYFGAQADINLWNPKVQPNDFSLAQIWVISDTDRQTTMEAGVMVNPTLYGDYETRLFTYWTIDAYSSTGCYNGLCNGFIQTNNEIAIDAILKTSSYDNSQFDINVKIFKDDRKDGNWWLAIQGKPMGYWPNDLIRTTQAGFKVVEWGGEVLNYNYRNGSTSTQMGSGHFSHEGYRRAAYFRNIQSLDEKGNFQDPIDPNTRTIVENPTCYDLQFDGTSNFYYGGPGRNPDCLFSNRNADWSLRDNISYELVITVLLLYITVIMQ